MEKIVYDNSGPVNHFDYMKKNCKYNKLTRENYAVINKNTSFYYRKNPDADSINKSDIERGRSPRYDLAADPKGLTYTDEWCEKHREAALKNFDMNMEYYKQVGKEFEDRLNEFLLTDGKEFKEYYSLNHEDMRKPGIYMLVLDEYKRIYIGSTMKQTLRRRIMRHWGRVMPFDRLIWGSADSSIIAIDSFGCLDTTRIFLIPFDVGEENRLYDEEFNYTSSPLIYDFLQNRASGGMTTYLDSVLNMRCMDFPNKCVKGLLD